MTNDLPYALAAQAAYDNVAPTFTTRERDANVFLSMIDDVHVLAFEGSTSIEDWMRNLEAFPSPVVNHPEFGWVHTGFLKDAQAVYPAIVAYLAAEEWPTYDLCGHSKGAECLLLAALLMADGHPPRRIRLFGPPHVGNSSLKYYFKDVDIVCYANYNQYGRDVVTLVPMGPHWAHMREPISLKVDDSLNLINKHRMAAYVAAMIELEAPALLAETA